ncbi:MAG: hypothetical protein IT431_11835 [Phycisphaerales bacterium]|nr:hypothetical protein [Phycisphaerales bacterium]
MALIVTALMEECNYECEFRIEVLELILGRPLSCSEKGTLCGYGPNDDWCEICPERPQCTVVTILPLPVPPGDLVGGDGSGWGSGGGGSDGGDPFGHDFDYCRELGSPCRGDGSENGVNLRNGAANLNAIDLALPAPGFAWRVGRSYSCQQWEEDDDKMVFYDSDTYQGANWFQISQPVLFLADAPNGDSYDRLYYYSGPQAKLELRRVDTVSGYSTDTWEAVGLAAAAAERKTTVLEEVTYDYYILYDKSGTQTYFFGGETAYGNAAWQFWKKVDRGGNTAFVGHATDPSLAKDGYTSEGCIETVYDSGGRRYCYTYSTVEGVKRLTQVLCENDAGSGWGDCGTETEVARVEYSYYQTGGTTYGDAGNLKMVTVTTPLSDASLSMVTRTYYRYWTGSWDVGNPGRSYAVQYVYSSEGLRRYDEDVSGTLENEEEEDLEPYASAYYEYDEDRRIELTWQNGECGCPGAVDGATVYRYETNSMLWEDSWLRRTVVSRPDGTFLTQYYSPTMLSTNTVITSADPAGSSYDYWLTEVVREDDGRVSEIRTPAANTGYPHNTSGTPSEPYGEVTASTSTGLIEVYVASDQTDLEFLPEHVKWKEGSSGDEHLVSTREYLDRRLKIGTDDAEILVPMDQYVWQYTEETETEAYHGMGSPPSGAYETQIGRAFYSSTDSDVLYIAPTITTVTLPVVSTAHNGSGTSVSSYRFQLQDGRVQYTKTADGIVNYTGYDSLTGLVEEVVEDVDTGLTAYDPPTEAGTTFDSSGDELHQATEFTYDDQGRSDTVKLHAHSTTGKERVTQTVYHTLADGRAAVLSIPRYVDDTTDSWYGPVGYTVSNHAGRTEAGGLITISSSGTTTDPINWINEGLDDPIAAVPTGSLARLSTILYDETGARALEARAYYNIPASGEGDADDHFDPTRYLYDKAMGRTIGVMDPTGTISRTEYDDLGRVVSRSIGTNDWVDASTPAFATSGTNNMMTTELLEYDGDSDGGNSYLTEVTRRVEDGSTGQRVTGFINDARGRTIVTQSPATPYAVSKYDNLGRVVANATYSDISGFDEDTDPTTTTSDRMSLSRTYHDERGQVYESREYKINQGTGVVMTSGSDVYLYSKSWYDSVGRPIKTLGEQIGKTVYDRLGRPTHSFVIATVDDSGYSDAFGVSGDIVLEESQTVYSEDTGSVLLSASISRFHDDYGTGQTTGPLDLNNDGGSASPLVYTAADILGRIQITASWYDEWDRLIDTVHYGTHGGSSFTYPASAPTSSSADELLTTITYDEDGAVLLTTDPEGADTKYEYDGLGRQLAVISNYTEAEPPINTANRDTDTYVRCEYEGGLLTEMWVDVDGDKVQDTGVDQVTTYTYGVTDTDDPAPSAIYANNLIRQVKYPDSTSDIVRYAYNAQGEPTVMVDQEGNSVASVYDEFGRVVERRATLDTGSDLDDAVLRIVTGYDDRGMVSAVTQYDNPTSGDVVDQVAYEYDHWGLLDKIHQDFNSVVTAGSGDELTVDYTHGTYTSPTARALRRTGLTLPDGTAITYQYAATGGALDAAINRASSVKVGTTTVATYEYLGLDGAVGTELPQPELLYNRFTPGASSGDYDRMDIFGRVEHDIWTRGIDTDTNGSYDVFRDFYNHQISRSKSSNIDLVQDHVYPGWDVAYTNDGLERLEAAHRGDWTGSAITAARFLEHWTLSQTGNWDLHQLDLDGDSSFGGTDELNDTGTFNLVNELRYRDKDSDTTDDVTLGYDDLGNLTDDGESYRYVYDIWGRLRKVLDRSDNLVAEYSYNGLGHRTGWHYDVDADSTVEANTSGNSDDAWYHWVHDDRWRQVATYRVLHYKAGGGWTWDEDIDNNVLPKEDFVYHNAGLAGYGSSSYIDSVILRDADSNTSWSAASDGTLEERTYYCQSWRADVVALLTDAGQLIQQVRYDPYGVPFGLSKADVNADGEVTSDNTYFGSTVWSDSSHPLADWNWDGTKDYGDLSDYAASYSADTDLGRGSLGYDSAVAGGNDRKGCAAYEMDPELTGSEGWEGVYHVRNRVYLSATGRWARRDPLGYVDGLSLYQYQFSIPVTLVDPFGLQTCTSAPCVRPPVRAPVREPVRHPGGRQPRDYRRPGPGPGTAPRDGIDPIPAMLPPGWEMPEDWRPYRPGQEDWIQIPQIGEPNRMPTYPKNPAPKVQLPTMPGIDEEWKPLKPADPEAEKLKKPGDCTWARYQALLKIQSAACAEIYNGLGGCTDKGTMTCSDMAYRRVVYAACANARQALAEECFRGGGETHRREISQQREVADKCKRLMDAGDCLQNLPPVSPGPWGPWSDEPPGGNCGRY